MIKDRLDGITTDCFVRTVTTSYLFSCRKCTHPHEKIVIDVQGKVYMLLGLIDEEGRASKDVERKLRGYFKATTFIALEDFFTVPEYGIL